MIRFKKENVIAACLKIVTANIEIHVYVHVPPARVHKTWNINVMVVSRKIERLILWISDVKFNDQSNPKRNLGRILLLHRYAFKQLTVAFWRRFRVSLVNYLNASPQNFSSGNIRNSRDPRYFFLADFRADRRLTERRWSGRSWALKTT